MEKIFFSPVKLLCILALICTITLTLEISAYSVNINNQNKTFGATAAQDYDEMIEARKNIKVPMTDKEIKKAGYHFTDDYVLVTENGTEEYIEIQVKQRKPIKDIFFEHNYKFYRFSFVNGKMVDSCTDIV